MEESSNRIMRCTVLVVCEVGFFLVGMKDVPITLAMKITPHIPGSATIFGCKDGSKWRSQSYIVLWEPDTI